MVTSALGRAFFVDRSSIVELLITIAAIQTSGTLKEITLRLALAILGWVLVRRQNIRIVESMGAIRDAILLRKLRFVERARVVTLDIRTTADCGLGQVVQAVGGHGAAVLAVFRDEHVISVDTGRGALVDSGGLQIRDDGVDEVQTHRTNARVNTNILAIIN